MTEWDAASYDRSSAPQQTWAGDVLGRLTGLPPDAAVLDVGCGTGRVTEQLLELVPDGRVLAIDASRAMVDAAAARLGDRATVWQADVLELAVGAPVDAVVSTAALHWVPDHARMWRRLAAVLRPGGRLEVQCGGRGNIASVETAIAEAAHVEAPELVGWSPWTFAGPQETEQRLAAAGFAGVRCWLQDRPTEPDDLGEFVRTSILPAHLDRLAPERREPFAAAVLARLRPPLQYVRLNVSAVRE